MLASGMNGMHIRLRFGSELPGPFSCGGTSDAPSACSGMRRRCLTLYSYNPHDEGYGINII